MNNGRIYENGLKNYLLRRMRTLEYAMIARGRPNAFPYYRLAELERVRFELEIVSAILEYRQQHGDKAWKNHSGYHRRSLAETAMFRLKTRFGERLSNRRFETQTTQAYARLAAMNIMTRLGMPDTVVAC